ncbi:hypothetical protein AGMMS50256_29020 [Betaproteobacteria bacterium]|nr:hypothetical protein AGMMS50256_29020 [Betaproteobacteria bacterium]
MSAPFRLTRPEPKETDIQASILQALSAHPSVAWANRMNAGAGKLAYPGGKASRFIRFGFPGMPDIIGQLTDGRFLGIECKRPSGKVSPEQAAFLEKSAKYHGVAFVARDVRTVWEVLETTKGNHS